MKNSFAFFLLICLWVGISPFPVFASTSMADQVGGRILLDVHRHGEGWYVDPLTKQRVYLGRPADAFVAMRTYGLGISNADLGEIPIAGQAGGGDMAMQLSGRIVLAVESAGEAWYIDPVTLTRMSLGTPDEALAVIRSVGLGITSENLVTIPMAGDVDVRYDVGYFRQAPLGDWNDRRQGEGCEESVALMTVAYVRGEPLSLEEARDAIIAMSDWEKETFGYYVDTSAADTRDRLLTQYLGYSDTTFHTGITVDDIREQLTSGNLVIVPVSGVVVNASYAGRAPVRHTVLMTGYDADDDTFLVHDPAAGSGFTRISASNLQSALMDYASGDHAPIGDLPNAMIIVALP